MQAASSQVSSSSASATAAEAGGQTAGQMPNLEQMFGDEQITCISFNQDQDAFAVGTNKGFSIFSLEPFRFRVKRCIEGGVKVVQMVGKSNLILVITSGQDPQYPSNHVHFWDDRKIKFVGRINQFTSDPLSLSHSQNIFIVAQQSVLSCMKMGQVETFATIQTNGNVRGGLHAVSSGSSFCVATCQDQVGCIDLTWFQKETDSQQQSSTTEQQNHLTQASSSSQSILQHKSQSQQQLQQLEEDKTDGGSAAAQSSTQTTTVHQTSGERIEQKSRVRVQAHENNIACLAMNHNGTLLATASTQGTLVRIFDPATSRKLGELRRGSTPTTICDLAFDLESKYLTCTSDKGTIHIFKVEHLLQSSGQQNASSGNTRSYFSALSSMVSYAGSEWSFAQFRLDPNQVGENELKSVVYQDFLHVVSKRGCYLRVAITQAGGNLTDYTLFPLFKD